MKRSRVEQAGEDKYPSHHHITRLSVTGLIATALWLATTTTTLAQTSPQPGITLSTSTLTVTEGTSNTYTVRLNTQPSAFVNVTPHVTPTDNSLVTTSPTFLIFTPTAWDRPLVITVTAAEDDDNNLPNTATISHTITGADYTSATPIPTVTVIINDNEPPTFGATTIAPQTYALNQNIRTLTLPDAIGGTLPLRYTLTSALPNGLAYTDATRTISGRPTATAAITTYTWTAIANNNARIFLTFTITVHPTDTCLRTPAVRDAIVKERAAPTCATITQQHLSFIESLSVTGQMNLTLQPEDFHGLSLRGLTLTDNGLQSLPEGIFNGLSSLQSLFLNNNQLTSLPANIFDGVRSTDGATLQSLFLHNNRLTTLPQGIFNGLSSVEDLNLNENPFTSLPGRLFAGMSALRILRLLGDMNREPEDKLQTLPVDIFSGIGGRLSNRLVGMEISLGRQGLTTLPAGIFSDVPRLTDVHLNHNQFPATLPAGLFDGARALASVTMTGNPHAPYALGVDAVQVGDGRLQVRIRQAAPFPVMVDWTINGQSGTATIAAGNRTSNTFGTPTTAPASVTLTNPRFGNSRFGPPTSRDLNLQLIQPRPGIIASTATLAVNEGATTIYTVALNTAPAGDVTVTPIVNPADSTVTVSNSLLFTTDIWHLGQTVTVTASLDDDTTGERVTLTHTVAGYPADNMRPIVVTVTDTRSHPTFDQATVPRQLYTVGTAITSLTLPAAIGGDSPLTYRLGNGQPFQTRFPGLTFTPTTRTVSGTPTAATREQGDPNRRYHEVQYTVQDADGQTATLDVLIAVDAAPEVLIEPTALTVEEIAMTTYTVSLATRPDDTVTLTPTVTPTDALTGATALTFTPTTWFQRQTVTLTAAVDADTTDDPATLTHTVTGYGSVTVPEISVTITDVISRPSFAVAALPGQTYTVRTAIPTLTLPPATGGTAPLSYVFTGTLPAGLTFTPDTATLSGVPTAVASTRTFTYTWTVTDRYALTATLTGTLIVHATNLCDRTAAIRAAILTRLPGVTDCATVTPAQISGVTTLSLTGALGNTVPRSRDFEGLSGLRTLNLGSNTFTSLPANLFDGLSALTELRLDSLTRLRTLPAGIFSRLDALERVFLSGNTAMTTLPAGLFSGLNALERVLLNGNTAMTTLPAGLFSGLNALDRLTLHQSGFQVLPEGLFDGLSGPLSALTLSGNPGAPFTFSVALEQRTNGLVRVHVPEAAPSRIQVTWTIPGTSDAPATVTIPKGARTSADFRVTSPTTVVLSHPVFPDISEPTNEPYVGTPQGLPFAGFYNGFALGIAADVAGISVNTATLTVTENDAQTYTVWLNAAPTGTVTVTPSATPASPPVTFSGALTFTPANWLTPVTITVTAGHDDNSAPDTLTITHTARGPGAYDGLAGGRIVLTVPDDDPDIVPDFGPATVTPRTYITGVAIPVLTLPEAMNGNGASFYTLAPRSAIPLALVLDPVTRTLSGIPALPGTVTLTWIAMDADADTDTLSVTLTIITERPPSFGPVIVAPRIWTQRSPIPALVLPEAVGGDGPLRYTLAPIPPGLTFDRDTRTLSGTPTTATAPIALTLTVTDSDSNTAPTDQAVLTVTITIQADTPPRFRVAAIAPQTWTAGHRIPTLTLPTATGGNGALRYTLTPALPAGLTLTPFTGLHIHTLTGVPLVAAPAVTLTWTVADADSNTAPADQDRVTVIVEVIPDSVPRFGDVTIPSRTYTSGATIPSFTLPEATGGNDTRHTLTPALPAGLILDPVSRVLSGTATEDLLRRVYTWRATDRDGDTDSLHFTLEIGIAFCSRTREVRETLLAQVPPSDCAAVTQSHLNTVGIVSIFDTGLTTLQSGDFAGLGQVTAMDLVGNPFTTLPGDIFQGLGKLLSLTLAGTRLTTLPENIFQRLTTLYGLTLATNEFSTLPADILDGLSGLRNLRLDGNRLTTLPEGLFDGIGPLDLLRLVGNRPAHPSGLFTLHLELQSLGSGRFQVAVREGAPRDIAVDWAAPGLSTTTATIPSGQRVSPPFTVSGASPADIVLSNPRLPGVNERTDLAGDGLRGRDSFNGFQLSVSPRPRIILDPATLTIPEGGMATYTVALTAAPTQAIRVTPVIDPAHPLTAAPLLFIPVHWSTPQTVTLRAGQDDDSAANTVTIRHTVTGYPHAADVPDLTVTRLDDDPDTVPVVSVPVAPRGYIAGAAIPPLTLPAAAGGNGALRYAIVGSLPDGLTLNGDTRVLSGIPTTRVPSTVLTLVATDADTDTDRLFFTVEIFASVCTRLPAVRNAIVAAAGVPCANITPAHLNGITGRLDLSDADLGSLRHDDLNGLRALTHLDLGANQLRALPADVFAGLHALIDLDLGVNRLSALPAGLFAGLRALTHLDLGVNDLTMLPGALLTDLRALTVLRLFNNRLTALPEGLFTGLTTLTSLLLDGNQTSPLTLTMVVEQRGNGLARLFLPQAAPLDIATTWTITRGINSGASGETTIAAGQRFSDTFGVPAETPPALTFTNHRFPGITEATDDIIGQQTGYQLATTPGQPDIIVAPTELNVPQNNAVTYRVWLGTRPVNVVTITPAATIIQPSDRAGIEPYLAGTGMTYDDILTDNTRDSVPLPLVPDSLIDPLPTLLITPANWHLAHTVTVTAGSNDDYSFIPIVIRHTVTGYGGLAADDVTAVVTSLSNTAAPSFGLATVAPQVYTVDVAIPTLTLPAAGGGDGPLRYALRPIANLPPGLRFNSDTRTITGRPTTVGIYTLSLFVEDADEVAFPHDTSDSDSLPLRFTIQSPGSPQLGTGTVPTQAYLVGTAIPPLTLPAATGGDSPLRYTLTPTRLPAGLTLNAAARTLTGTPRETAPLVRYTWTALDRDDDADSLTFSLVVYTAVCARTPGVRAAILSTTGRADCAAVTTADLGGITALTPADGIAVLNSGDFDGLTALQRLVLDRHTVTALPGDIFYYLDTLTFLSLTDTRITTLPAGIFQDLRALTTLVLRDNRLVALPEDLFAPLTALRSLELDNNRIQALPRDLFDSQAALTSLNLSGNRLTDLPADLFAGASALTTLALHDNQLQTLPPGLFDGLDLVNGVRLHGNTGSPFSLFIQPELGGGGRFQARVRTATPRAITLTWTIAGVTSGTATIEAGRRTSGPFGLRNLVSLPVELSDPTFVGLTEPTHDDDHAWTGLQLATVPSDPGGVITPDRLTIPEGGHATYTVRLRTIPTGIVTVTPSVPTDNVLRLSAPLVFAPRTWHRVQTVTVSTAQDQDAITDIVTISHSVSGYGALTAFAGVIVTVPDRFSSMPFFGGATVAPQVYRVGVAIPTLTLPAAIGGSGSIVYSLDRRLPDGLTVDLNTRTLTGTPTRSTAPVTYNWIVTDRDPLRGATSLPFTIEITGSVCTRTEGVRRALESATGRDCSAITGAHLRRIVALDLSGAGIAVLQSEDFLGLDSLLRLNLSGNRLTTLPPDIFAGTGTTLTALNLAGNRLTTLPDGLFDGVSQLTELALDGNDGSPFTLGVSLERQGAGARVTIPQATPLAITVPWAAGGGITGVAGIAAGQRVSGTFGPPSTSSLTIRAPTLVGVTERTDDVAGAWRGFRLAVTLGRPGVQITPLTLDIAEGGRATYTVALRTPPAGVVTVTPFFSLANDALALSSAVSFAPATWYRPRTVTVTALQDVDRANERLIINHVASNYGHVTVDSVTVTVADADADSVPSFAAAMVADQSYTLLSAIDALTLPPAVGGNGTLRYALTPSLPDGLNFAAATRVVSGVPRAWAPPGVYTLTATDRDADTASLRFRVTIATDVCSRSAQIRDLLVSRIPGVSHCREITPAHLRALSVLVTLESVSDDGQVISGFQIRSVRSGDFAGLSGLTRLVVGLSPVVSLPGDIFAGLSALTELDWTGSSLSSLPTGLFAGLNSLTRLVLGDNRYDVLPEGLFDGFHGHLSTLLLGGSIGITFTLHIDLEQQGDGRVRARIREAAPLPVAVDWMLAGSPMGTVTIETGRRTSAPFGTATMSPADVSLHNARFPGVMEDTSETSYFFLEGQRTSSAGNYAGFQLGIIPNNAGVHISPATLPISEGGAASYTVWLNTAPAGDVTVTPVIGSAGAMTVSAPLVFTTANWHTRQTVIVVADDDEDSTDERVTIGHDVDGYGDITTAADLVVEVSDDDPPAVPGFGLLRIAPQVYGVGGTIAAMTLPAAIGGRGLLTYALTPALPAGLSIDPTTRTLTGTPTRVAPARAYAWVATDPDGDTASLPFTIEIVPSVCGRTPAVREALLTAVGAATCADVTPDDLRGIARLDVSGQGLDVLQSEDFGGLSGLRGLDLSHNQLRRLPDGLFDGLALTQLALHSNPGSPFALSIELEQRGQGRARLVLQQAAPLTIEVAWRGDNGATGTATLAAGRRTSEPFGTASDLPVSISLGLPDLPGVTEPTDDLTGDWTGFRLTVPPPVPAVLIAPATLVVPEGGAVEYTVGLNTAPTGTVIVTPRVPAGSGILVSGAPVFSPANWHRLQNVIVSAGQDEDSRDASIVIGHDVAGYGRLTVADDLAVTVADDDPDTVPAFDAPAPAPRTYTTGVAIPVLSLPAANGGNGALVYTLSGALPAGLSFDMDARTLTGTPTFALLPSVLTLTATDLDTDTAGFRFTLEVRVGVCDRTPVVSDAIRVAAGLDTCAAVTLDQLSRVTVLNLRNRGIGTLRSGDFEGLGALRELDLGGNPLTVLPEDVFVGLDRLASLLLSSSHLTALPEDVFAGLGALRTLTINGVRGGFGTQIRTISGITSLPAGIFNGLGSLETLDLRFNRIAALSTDIFNGLGQLRDLDLTINPISVLPEGVFNGIGRVQRIRIRSEFPPDRLPDGLFDGLFDLRDFNSPTFYTLYVQLQQQGNGQVRAYLREGAPFPVSVDWQASDGTTGRATIERGRRTSDVLGLATSSPGSITITNVHSRYELVINPVVGRRPNAPQFPNSGLILAIAQSNAGVRFSPDTLTVPEGGAAGYAVWLNTPPTGDVVVTPAVAPDDSDVSASVLRFTTANWYRPQTIFVSVGEDDDFTDDTATISHTVSGYGSITGFGPVVVTVTDTSALRSLRFVAAVAPQAYLADSPVPPLVLPAATGGSGRPTYTLRPALPAGLTLNTSTLTLSGTPAVMAPETVYTWVATDRVNRTASLTFTLEVQTGVCSRTPVVRQALMAAAGVATCGDVTPAHLRGIPELFLSGRNIGTFQSGDFDGLDALTRLDLSGNRLATLPAEVFGDLGALTDLNLSGNRLATLPAGLFADLQALTTLSLSGNQLAALPAGLFDALQALTTLSLSGNRLTTLPAGLFDALRSVASLNLADNRFTTLSAAFFSSLGSLTTFDLSGNRLVALPVNLFTALGRVVNLNLSGNRLDTLPVDLFGSLSILVSLNLSGNRFATLPAGVLSGLPALVSLNLSGNQLATLPDGVFEGLASSTVAQLDVSGNPGSPFRLAVELEQLGDGRARARIRPAAPRLIEFTWTGPNGVATPTTIAAGEFTSAPFGGVSLVPQSLTLGDVRFVGIGAGAYQGVSLVVASTRDGVLVAPTALTVPEGGLQFYTVRLNTAPTGAVTVTLTLTADDDDIRVPASLVFRPATWHRVQRVNVAADQDVDGQNDTATIRHTVSGYGAVTTADPVIITVSDDDSVPDFRGVGMGSGFCFHVLRA